MRSGGTPHASAASWALCGCWVSKCPQGRASMLHFYTRCDVNASQLTCGQCQARIPSFSGPAAVVSWWPLAVRVPVTEPGSWAARSAEHTHLECLNSPRRDRGIPDPPKALLCLDSSVELQGQYLMTEWLNPSIAQQLKWCQLQSRWAQTEIMSLLRGFIFYVTAVKYSLTKIIGCLNCWVYTSPL